MSFYIYDINGYVGDLASNKGLDDLAIYIKKHPDMDDLERLMKDGTILKTDALMEELKSAGVPKDPDIRDTFNNLKTLIEKAADVIIITMNPEGGVEDAV